jgi:dTDP-4-amino-4,6-dideoxygalactose transaminase
LCPRAEEFYARAVSLPIFPGLTDADVARVIDTVTTVAREVLS